MRQRKQGREDEAVGLVNNESGECGGREGSERVGRGGLDEVG